MSRSRRHTPITGTLDALRARAFRTFGNEERAERWLTTPSDVLGGKAPVDVVSVEGGTRSVEDLLDRIDHGLAT